MDELTRWKRMTPQKRDYDRFVGRIPRGASWTCETQEGSAAIRDRAERDEELGQVGCSCHINPPCNFCVDYEALDD